MNLEDAKKALQDEQDKLISFMQKSYKNRIKWVKQGKVLAALNSEIGIALSSGRTDIIENLLIRQRKIVGLTQMIEHLEYTQIFDRQEIALPKETTDSTIILKDANSTVANDSK